MSTSSGKGSVAAITKVSRAQILVSIVPSFNQIIWDVNVIERGVMCSIVLPNCMNKCHRSLLYAANIFIGSFDAPR